MLRLSCVTYLISQISAESEHIILFPIFIKFNSKGIQPEDEEMNLRWVCLTCQHAPLILIIQS